MHGIEGTVTRPETGPEFNFHVTLRFPQGLFDPMSDKAEIASAFSLDIIDVITEMFIEAGVKTEFRPEVGARAL